MISVNKLILDASFIIKSVIPPKDSGDPERFKKERRKFFIANRIMSHIFTGRISAEIPSSVLVEISAVASKITKNVQFGLDLAEKIQTCCKIIYDEELIRDAIHIAAHTFASGIDALLITSAKLSKTPLITDDEELHKICKNHKIKSYFLSEIED